MPVKKALLFVERMVVTDIKVLVGGTAIYCVEMPVRTHKCPCGGAGHFHFCRSHRLGFRWSTEDGSGRLDEYHRKKSKKLTGGRDGG